MIEYNKKTKELEISGTNWGEFIWGCIFSCIWECIKVAYIMLGLYGIIKFIKMI
jgi:hypothetical protein